MQAKTEFLNIIAAETAVLRDSAPYTGMSGHIFAQRAPLPTQPTGYFQEVRSLVVGLLRRTVNLPTGWKVIKTRVTRDMRRKRVLTVTVEGPHGWHSQVLVTLHYN